MPTTIQVSELTKQLLDALKKGSKKSYDQIIREILAKKLEVPDSLAGAYPDLK